MNTDSELLTRYTESGDEAAFGEVVRRYLDMVYSVALRMAMGDSPLAQDVTQIVFTDLTRKARTLAGRETLAGWLHTSTRYTASNVIRSERRRRARELEAFTMHENTSESDINWEQLRPLLDESIGQLDEGDRDVIVLRFFQNKSHRDVGTELGLSENSANKRVERALEKLRDYFSRRGITVSSALLATAMSGNSVQAAPMGFADKVAAASLTGTVGGGLGSIFLIMNTKIKTILAVLVLAAIAATLAMQLHWPRSQPASANSTSPAPKPSAGSQSVQAPVVVALKPATPSATSPVVFVAEPKADLESAISTSMHFLESKDDISFFKTIWPMPEDGDYSPMEVAKGSEAAVARDKSMADMLEALRAIKGKSPVIEHDEVKTTATYTLNPPVSGYKIIIFSRIDDAQKNAASIPIHIPIIMTQGCWYIDSIARFH